MKKLKRNTRRALIILAIVTVVTPILIIERRLRKFEVI